MDPFLVIVIFCVVSPLILGYTIFLNINVIIIVGLFIIAIVGIPKLIGYLIDKKCEGTELEGSGFTASICIFFLEVIILAICLYLYISTKEVPSIRFMSR